MRLQTLKPIFYETIKLYFCCGITFLLQPGVKLHISTEVKRYVWYKTT